MAPPVEETANKSAKPCYPDLMRMRVLFLLAMCKLANGILKFNT